MELIREIEKMQDDLFEAIGQSMSLLGYSVTLGRLFGLLYFADQPLSLDEMAEQLMVSKATISLNIRFLESLKFAQKVWQKGSRKDYYIAERDFEKNFQGVIKLKSSELEVFKSTINSVLDRYEAIWQETANQEIKTQVEKAILKINELKYWLAMGERWIEFFMANDLKDGPGEDLQRISVEWKDD